MKTIYKILFSLCSTFVCCAHSVRAFADSCRIYSSADITSTFEPGGYTYETKFTGCTDWEYLYLFHSGYPEMTNMTTTYYDKGYTCTACETGYKLRTGVFTGTYYKAGGETSQCTYTRAYCEWTGDGVECTENADCPDKEESFMDLDGATVAFTRYNKSCVSKKCAYAAPFSLVLRTGTGNKYWSDTGITCFNGYYSHAPLIFSQAGETWVEGCERCPDIGTLQKDWWGITVYDDYIKGGGTQLGKCYIKKMSQTLTNGTTVNRSVFADDAGIFELTGDCYYS